MADKIMREQYERSDEKYQKTYEEFKQEQKARKEFLKE